MICLINADKYIKDEKNYHFVYHSAGKVLHWCHKGWIVNFTISSEGV